MSEWTIWVCPGCENQARTTDSGVVYCHNCADSRPVKVVVVPKAKLTPYGLATHEDLTAALEAEVAVRRAESHA